MVSGIGSVGDAGTAGKGPVRGPMAEAAERRRGGRFGRLELSSSGDGVVGPTAGVAGDKEARVSRWVSEARPEPRLSNPLSDFARACR